MQIAEWAWVLFFLGVGFIAVRAALQWYRAGEEQARREEEEGGCQFFRHHRRLLAVSVFLDSLGGVLT
jgi:hypothetical protein